MYLLLLSQIVPALVVHKKQMHSVLLLMKEILGYYYLFQLLFSCISMMEVYLLFIDGCIHFAIILVLLITVASRMNAVFP